MKILYRIIYLEFKKNKTNLLIIFPIIFIFLFIVSIFFSKLFEEEVRSNSELTPVYDFIFDIVSEIIFFFQFVLLPIIIGACYIIENKYNTWNQLFILPIQRSYFVIAKAFYIICIWFFIITISGITTFLTVKILTISHLGYSFDIKDSIVFMIITKIFLMVFLYHLCFIGVLLLFYSIFKKLYIVIILNIFIILLSNFMHKKFQIETPFYLALEFPDYLYKVLSQENKLTFNFFQILYNIIFVFFSVLLSIVWVNKKSVK